MLHSYLPPLPKPLRLATPASTTSCLLCGYPDVEGYCQGCQNQASRLNLSPVELLDVAGPPEGRQSYAVADPILDYCLRTGYLDVPSQLAVDEWKRSSQDLWRLDLHRLLP